MEQNKQGTVKPEITYEDFSKLDIRAGTVLSAEKVEGAEKLIPLPVEFQRRKDFAFMWIHFWNSVR